MKTNYSLFFNSKIWYNIYMKKLLIMLSILLLVGCNNKNLYDVYKDELNNINESSKDIPLTIKVETEKLNDSLYVYRALIDKNDEDMKDIEALLIHNKESENAFPSMGIFEDKKSIYKDSEKKGIKLSGYVEDIDNIEFKLLIKYKNKDDEVVKYYYVENMTKND